MPNHLPCLELGAVDFITKPKIDLREGMEEQTQDLIDKIKAASLAKVRGGKPLVQGAQQTAVAAPAPMLSSANAQGPLTSLSPLAPRPAGRRRSRTCLRCCHQYRHRS